MRTSVVIASLACVALLSGCDSAELYDQERFVRPTVSVYFVNGSGSSVNKNQALVDVELIVTTISGQDYSPDKVTVDNATQSTVTFDLVLPPDSVYGFRVRISENDQLTGEGGVLQLVTEESSQINIPVVSLTTGPWLAVVPSLVNIPAGPGQIDLIMRYYGSTDDVAGIATRINVTGADPVPVDFVGADIIQIEGNETSLSWYVDTIASDFLDLGMITVPRSQSSEFCLEIPLGDARIVNSAGEITIIEGSGACVNVSQ
jgi:hypothetical protein